MVYGGANPTTDVTGTPPPGTTTTWSRFDGPTPSSTGECVAVVEGINGRGVATLLIGAPDANGAQGEVYAVWGSNCINGTTGACTQCARGYWVSGGVCTECPANTFSTSGTAATCTACTACNTCSLKTGCLTCGAGKKITGTTCEACGNNEWSNTIGTTCTACTACNTCNPTNGNCLTCGAGKKITGTTCEAISVSSGSGGEQEVEITILMPPGETLNTTELKQEIADVLGVSVTDIIVTVISQEGDTVVVVVTLPSDITTVDVVQTLQTAKSQ